MRRLTGKRTAGTGLRGRRRLVRAIGATAIMTGVAGVALVAATAAQASWTPVTTLTGRTWEGIDPAISANAKGAFITAWQAINNADPNCGNQIQIRLRSSAGTWGSIHQLTPCGGPGMIFPAVAYNPAGYGVVAWLRAKDDAIQAVTVSPAGKIGPVLTVTPKPSQAYFPLVAVSPSGQALVVWETINATSTGPNGVLARFVSPGSALGPVRFLGASTQLVSAPVFDKTGTATVAYTATKVYEVRLGTGYLPHIAIDPAGAGLITWQSTTYQSGLVTTIYGRHVTATNGTFGSLIKFTADGEHAQIAVDQSGRSGVIWLRSSNAPLVQARLGS